MHFDPVMLYAFQMVFVLPCTFTEEEYRHRGDRYDRKDGDEYDDQQQPIPLTI
jgi:hypothetical protein